MAKQDVIVEELYIEKKFCLRNLLYSGFLSVGVLAISVLLFVSSFERMPNIRDAGLLLAVVTAIASVFLTILFVKKIKDYCAFAGQLEDVAATVLVLDDELVKFFDIQIVEYDD